MILQKWTDREARLETAIKLIHFIDNNFESCNEEARSAIYSSTTELITNIRQHAYPDNFKSRATHECEITLTKTHEDNLSITVTDHGITIPQSIINKLFCEADHYLNSQHTDSTLINEAVFSPPDSSRGKGLSTIATLVNKGIFSSLSITSRQGHLHYSYASDKCVSDSSLTTEGTAIEFVVNISKADTKPLKKDHVEISVAKDFSEYPAGRYMEDGIYSGEAFRENILIPNLEQYEIITLSLDGGCGYGSSFLEEAFGGLVRHGHTATDLEGRLNLISAKNPHLIREIWKYIRSN